MIDLIELTLIVVPVSHTNKMGYGDDIDRRFITFKSVDGLITFDMPASYPGFNEIWNKLQDEIYAQSITDAWGKK